MAFEELKSNTADVQDHLKKYIDSNIAYYKLWGFKVAMKSSTLLFKFSLIFVSICMFLLFFSFSLAFAIGDYLNSYSLGFVITGGFYFVFALFVYFSKIKFLESKFLILFSEIFFND
jgi:hypothetical protein